MRRARRCPWRARSSTATAECTTTFASRSPIAAICAASTACPKRACPFLPRDELLTFDEIIRVARVARNLGVTALRITGGEPLVRKGLPVLIERLSALGFEDLALTTNGTVLAHMAADAGLGRTAPGQRQLRLPAAGALRRHPPARPPSRRPRAPWMPPRPRDSRPLKVNVVLLRGQQRRRDPRLRLVRTRHGTHRALHRVHAA